MSAIVSIPNFSDRDIKERSYLDQDSAANAFSVLAKSSNGAGTGLYLLAGTPASEAAEIRRITSVSGNTVSVNPAFLQPHTRYTDLIMLYCNQFKVYRANPAATQPPDSAFTFIDVVNIDPEQSETDYVDAGGSAAHWYKFTSYNEATGAETSLADSQATVGDDSTHYCSIADIRRSGGLEDNRWISDQDIDSSRTAAESEVNGILSGIYNLPLPLPYNETVVYVTTELAVGLLLGSYSGSQAEGTKRAAAARAILDRIKARTLRLTDITGADTSIGGGNTNIGGYPDETVDPRTASTSVSNPTHVMGHVFSMDQKF